MRATRSEPRPPADKAPLGLRVLPELRRSLKVRAAQEGLSMEDWLHRLLCRELDREDLMPLT